MLTVGFFFCLLLSHALTIPFLPTASQINKRGTENELDDWCFVVGYYNQEQTSVHLLNPIDPTEGIMVSYNGDYCNGGKQRKFNIELQCTDKLNPVPTHAYELSGCEYTVYMPSVYGCPLECPVANRALCGGQGHCAYDNDKKSARCYCNHGYSGDDCTADGTAADEQLNYSPALLGLIITLFIIVALLVRVSVPVLLCFVFCGHLQLRLSLPLPPVTKTLTLLPSHYTHDLQHITNL